jgi:hypothetical protein
MSASNVIRFTLPKDNILSPRGLQTGLATTANALAVMQVYTSLVLEQADIDANALQENGGKDSDPVPGFRHHQQGARNLAQYFRDELDPRVIGLLTGVSGRAAQFKAFLAEADKLLPRITDPDDTAAREEVTALFSALESATGEEENRITALRTDLQVFSEQIKTANKELTADLQAIEQQIEKGGGKLDQLQQQIDDAQGAIRAAIGTIAVSAISITGGAAMIVIGAIGDLATPAANAVIIAGVGFVATGVTGTVTASVTLDNNNKKLLRLYQSYSEISATLAVLKVWQDQALSLSEAASDQVAAVGALGASWGNICNGIADVGELVRTAGPDVDVVRLEGLMRTARGAWADLLGQVEKVEQHLTGFTVQRSEALPQPASG